MLLPLLLNNLLGVYVPPPPFAYGPKVIRGDGRVTRALDLTARVHRRIEKEAKVKRITVRGHI